MTPITAKTPNRAAFRMMRKNAFFAEVQNGFPRIAIWMYAFLLRNFTSFSKHQMQQPTTFRTYIITLFFCAFATRSKYFK